MVVRGLVLNQNYGKRRRSSAQIWMPQSTGMSFSAWFIPNIYLILLRSIFPILNRKWMIRRASGVCPGRNSNICHKYSDRKASAGKNGREWQIFMHSRKAGNHWNIRNSPNREDPWWQASYEEDLRRYKPKFPFLVIWYTSAFLSFSGKRLKFRIYWSGNPNTKNY